MLNNPPPLLAGGVGSYNCHDIGEEVEWRPRLLYVNPSRNLAGSQKSGWQGRGG